MNNDRTRAGHCLFCPPAFVGRVIEIFPLLVRRVMAVLAKRNPPFVSLMVAGASHTRTGILCPRLCIVAEYAMDN